jgi:hypothetical protein
MMHFHEDEDPNQDRTFWAIMFVMILLVMFFVIETFVRFYLEIN